jgi:hypothetical protein
MLFDQLQSNEGGHDPWGLLDSQAFRFFRIDYDVSRCFQGGCLKVCFQVGCLEVCFQVCCFEVCFQDDCLEVSLQDGCSPAHFV